MDVNELPLGPYQPFYNVLVEDGSYGYEAQGKKNEISSASRHLVGMTYSLDLQAVTNQFSLGVAGMEILCEISVCLVFKQNSSMHLKSKLPLHFDVILDCKCLNKYCIHPYPVLQTF